MDQEKEIREINEIEEIKHLLIEFLKAQETILKKLEHISHAVDQVKHQTSEKTKSA